MFEKIVVLLYLCSGFKRVLIDKVGIVKNEWRRKLY